MESHLFLCWDFSFCSRYLNEKKIDAIVNYSDDKETFFNTMQILVPLSIRTLKENYIFHSIQ